MPLNFDQRAGEHSAAVGHGIMSFEWDPNDDDDSDSDNDLNFSLPSNWAATTADAFTSEPASKTTTSILQNDFDAALSGDDDDDDDMMVNWEDADESLPNKSIVPPYAASAPTASYAESADQPVLPNDLQAIDLGKRPQDKKAKANPRKQKPRRRNVYKYNQLPQQMQHVLRNLQRAHLLAWASHVTYVASDEIFPDEAIAIAISVIPSTFWNLADDEEVLCIPTKLQLHDFCTWYTDWLLDRLRPPARRGGQARRRQAEREETANSLTSPLAPSLRESFSLWLKIVFSTDGGARYMAKKNPYHSFFSNLLLYAMVRHGLRWRVRWCMGLNNIITMDLHVHHPWLLSSTRNVFLAVARHKAASEKTNKRVSSEKRKRERPAISEQCTTDTTLPMLWGWMEILTLEQSAARQCMKRWMHVDTSSFHSEAFCINDTKTVEPTMTMLDNELTSYTDSASAHPSRYQKTNTSQRKRSKSTLRNVMPVAYVLAVEHQEGCPSLPDCHWIDLTPRYASSSVKSLQARGLSRSEIEAELAGSPSQQSKWWKSTIRCLNQTTALPLPGSSARHSIVLDSADDDQKPSASKEDDCKSSSECTPGLLSSAKEFKVKHKASDRFAAADVSPQNLFSDKGTASATPEAMDEGEMNFSHSVEKEPMPTSKSGFASHPVYVLKSQLGKTQVLSPDAQRCGLFGGESVFLRRDVTVAQEAHAWLYQNRKVKSTCLRSPVVKLKARKKPAQKGFIPLASYGVGAGNDGSEEQRAAEIASASQPESEQEKDRLLYAKWQTV